MTFHKVWESRNIITSKDQQSIIFTKLNCTTDETKLLFTCKFVCGEHRNPWSWPPAKYQDLTSTNTPWLACQKDIIRLANQVEGNSEYTFSNSMRPLGAQNKELTTAKQIVYASVRLHYVCDRGYTNKPVCVLWCHFQWVQTLSYTNQGNPDS